MQVFPDDVLHRRAVGVGDLLPLGQGRGERLQRVRVLLRPFGRDRVALDRKVLGGALVQIGEFLQACCRLAAADERLGDERRDDGAVLSREGLHHGREGHVGSEVHLPRREAVRGEQRIDQQGADVVRRVDRDGPALELADLADRRSALDQQGQDVRLQEGGLGDDAQVGPWRAAAELVLDVGEVVSGGDVEQALLLTVDQVPGWTAAGY